jgi:glycosyltransferase involved in cell wall biosynthesis
MKPQGICLNMIVKNEAPVIRRCLDSVRSIINYWVIVDTGSTDGTQDIVREHLRGLPGELHERPWRDFAHNRSEALALARPHGDYSLIIDADDTLDIRQGFQLPGLTSDAYILDICDATIRYQRIQVVRNALPWRYQGVLHEYLTCEGARPADHLPIVMRRNHDGARRRDPETYRKDAAILAGALMTETDPFLIARYTFYLAQSHRDCGEKVKAIEAYLHRAEFGYWDQEVFYSLYKAAQLKEELGHDREDVLKLYLRASGVAPSRAEPLHGASRLCRIAGRHQLGYEIAKRGLALIAPLDALFVEPWIYDYGLLDEFAVNAYWAGRHRDCLKACLRMLAEEKLPASMVPRIAANARFAADKLSADCDRLHHAYASRQGKST